MSLRIQKKWSQLGSPKAPGTHDAKGIGKILDVSVDHIEQALRSDDPTVVLEHVELAGMTPHWKIMSIG
jgi:hypothetical protein